MVSGHITLSGDLGSGKSSVACALGERRALTVFSTGQIQRQIASEMGSSTLETNLLAESDATIDARIDQRTVELGSSREPIVFDSRLAWHFVPGAFKVHLVVDPARAAERIESRSYPEENYLSRSDAARFAEERLLSERRRFMASYNVDIARLRNYDLVIDTTGVTVQEVVDCIEIGLEERAEGTGPVLRIGPQRIMPTERLEMRIAEDMRAHPDEVVGMVGLVYSRPFFYCLSSSDHLVVSRGVRSAAPLLAGTLLFEEDELLPIGVSAARYFQMECRPSTVYTWEDVHQFRFVSYPPFFPVGGRDV
jgi:predicted cytidylate kinase